VGDIWRHIACTQQCREGARDPSSQLPDEEVTCCKVLAARRKGQSLSTLRVLMLSHQTSNLPLNLAASHQLPSVKEHLVLLAIPSSSSTPHEERAIVGDLDARQATIHCLRQWISFPSTSSSAQDASLHQLSSTPLPLPVSMSRCRGRIGNHRTPWPCLSDVQASAWATNRESTRTAWAMYSIVQTMANMRPPMSSRCSVRCCGGLIDASVGVSGPWFCGSGWSCS